MNMLAWFKRGQTRSQVPPSSWDLMQSGTLGFPYSHSRVLAENLSVISACISLISSSIASLPLFVYRQDGTNRHVVPSHPLQQLIDHGPNPQQSWYDLMESVMSDCLLHGNTLVEVHRDTRGQVTGLTYIPWRLVSPQILGSGTLRFDVQPVPPSQPSRRLLASEVWHVADRSDDGYLGRSRLARASLVLQLGLSMQDFGVSLYQHSTNPSGVLQAPESLSEKAVARLRESFNQLYAGSGKAGRVLLLDAGVQWHKMSIDPDSAEFLASRKFQTEELCRLYAVPPPMIGHMEHSTLNNVEHLLSMFLNLGLSPWLRKLEQSMRQALLTDPALLVEFNANGWIRGDTMSRWQSYEIAARSQILTSNEIRALEGFPPREGGDTVLTLPGQIPAEDMPETAKARR